MKTLSRSTLLAIALAAAVALWMLSGLIGGEDGADPAAPVAGESMAADESVAMAVSVRESRAAPVNRRVEISARTAPNRQVDVAAQTDGRIVSIDAERGAAIGAGERIAAIEMRDREARAAEARALVRQRELEHEAAQSLSGREFSSRAQIAEALARLESARAALANIEQEIEQTTITAPFAGVIEERGVEMGDYVGIGDPVASLVDVDPLIAVGDISERNVQALAIGNRGKARLLSGEVVEGTVRYLSPVADEATRTFRLELAIPNPGSDLRAGMSAQILLSAGEVRAHQLSPALLTLDDEGNIGVKTVDQDNRVRFHPVEVVESGSEGIWVTGLPARADVITVGQGFVAPGERVRPVHADQGLRIEESEAP